MHHSLVVALSGLAALLAASACPSKDALPPVHTSSPTAVVEPAAAAEPKKAAYSCPMHPEVTSDIPGKCPKCGMDLVSTAPQPSLAVTVSTTPAKPKAGEKARLVFEMKTGDARVTKFDVVHEKQLHLLMVTPDLAWFAHEHPEPQPDGTFVLEFAFPSGGTYRLFSDFKASGRGGAVLTTDVIVDGIAKPLANLTPSNLKAPRSVDGHEVRFTAAPPVAGVEKTLTFVVTKGGKPVTNLEPYLGAMGHLVVIGSDAKTFLHAHPEDHAGDHAAKPHVDPVGAAPHEHPTTGIVSFATKFPHPGLYKAWAQFQVKGKPIIADFVFDVPAGAPGATDVKPAAGDGHAHQH